MKSRMIMPGNLSRAVAPVLLGLAWTASAVAGVRLPARADDCVRWAASELTSTLGPAEPAADIRVAITPKTGADEQSYAIRKNGNAVLIEAGGSLGAMYGLQDLAEQVRNSGATNWQQDVRSIAPVTEHPFVEVRADNSFIHVNPLALNNLPMWREYIDMLARNRYTMLDLHGGYDLDSTDFPNLYPQLIHVPDYPNVGNIAEQNRNLASFKAVVAYAKSRGIKVAFMNYSAANGSEGPRKYEKTVTGVPVEKLADYTAKAVAILIREVPDLCMLGFRVGESGQKATFFQDAYLKGIDDSGRKDLPLYTRSWGTTKGQLEALAQAAHAGFDIEIKYNGEHLGLPYQALQDTGSKYSPSYSYEDYLNVPANYRIIWQVRANGTHRFFAWENTDFIRRAVKTFRLGNAVGFTLEPLTAYFSTDPAAYYASKNDQNVYSYIWQKHWMWYYGWGRLGYDPDMPEARMIKAYEQHYGSGGPAVYRTLQKASEIVPLVYSYRFQGPDQRQYSPETETGNFYVHKNIRQDLLQFAYGEPADPRSFAGIDEFVNEKLAGQPDGRVPPGVVAARLNADAKYVQDVVPAVTGLTGQGAAEWRLLKTDMLSAAWLARYYADRMLAETYLDYSLKSGQKSDYDKAVQLLATSRKDWSDLAAIAEAVYRPLHNPLNGQPVFRWLDEVPRMEKLDATASALWASRPPDAKGPALHLETVETASLGVTGLRHTVPSGGATATVVCRAAGSSKAFLWYKPLPTMSHWQKTEMKQTAASEFSATVPLTPSGLMYLVEVRDRNGHARNFPDVFQETPYRVIPAFRAELRSSR
ncbi:MAG TPA: hypothetical protein VG675_17075 [Bryobacteraceae bacterium]|nr:hypothetical protein [Bryobacteraceae bacterium]